MTLDITTMMVINVMITLFCGAALHFYQRYQKTYPAFGFFTASFYGIALGYLSLILFGKSLSTWGIVPLVHGAFITGAILRFDGISRFTANRKIAKSYYLVPLLFIIGYATIDRFFWPSWMLRNVCLALLIQVPTLLSARTLYRNATAATRAIYQAFGALYLCYGVVIMLRPLLLLSNPPDSVFRADLVQAPYFLMITLFEILSCVAFLIMNSQRLEQDLTRAERNAQDEARRSQKYLEVAGVMLMALDQEGKIALINQKGCEVLGVSEREALGKNWFDHFLPQATAPAVKAVFRQILAGDLAPVEHYENSIVTSRGAERMISFHNALLTDGSGKISGVLFSGEDITDRQQIERELRQAHKMESIGTMAGGISHHFNNILSAILGYAEMAREEIPEESPAAVDIDNVLIAANRAKELVKQITAFSRQGSFVAERCQPGPLLEEYLAAEREKDQENIRIEEKIEPFADEIALDPLQFKKIFDNLCRNGCDAMLDIGGVLTVTLRKIGGERLEIPEGVKVASGQFVELTVSDTGLGIPAEHRDRIFDPFFTTKAVGEGAGIGLSVVHGIVSRNGGWIKAESEAGAGATFMVYLPVAEKGVVVETSGS